MSSNQESITLVGWDGSEAADQALAWAASRARRCGGRVIVAQVVPPAALTPPSGGLPPDLLEDQRAAVLRTMTETVAHAARKHGLSPEIEILPSLKPADSLIEAAVRWGADLLCVGTSGMGGVARAILGSTADQLAHRSPIPLVLCPR